MTPETPRVIVAVITGERGQREIVRPLAAVGERCVVLDWEEFAARVCCPHLRFPFALQRLLRAHPGSVVFTDMNSAFLAVIVVACSLLGMPVVLRLRGDPFAETRDQLRFHWRNRAWLSLIRAGIAWLLDRPLFARVSRFVPVSDWVVRRLHIEARSAVVRIPVEVDGFPIRSHETAGRLRLLAVTNFNYPQKVAPLGRFLDEHGDFLRAQEIGVTIAGAGIALESFRAEHGGQAALLGFVSDVAALYAAHDVFIHFSDLDAFPYVVLEAQASGLPVLVNRACGMLEQVEHDRTGLIVDLTDRSQIEAHLRSLSEPAIRTRLGTAARAHVAATYSLQEIGRQLLDRGLPSRQPR
ncbi:MAG TPA: glycosyltransferase family 4 protein [Chthoniobacteraceae bacterium]|nr:glycosyltransferase family 4 protein [Chthoniobacteraceae bacterium]